MKNIYKQTCFEFFTVSRMYLFASQKLMVSSVQFSSEFCTFVHLIITVSLNLSMSIVLKCCLVPSAFKIESNNNFLQITQRKQFFRWYELRLPPPSHLLNARITFLHHLTEAVFPFLSSSALPSTSPQLHLFSLPISLRPSPFWTLIWLISACCKGQ